MARDTTPDRQRNVARSSGYSAVTETAQPVTGEPEQVVEQRVAITLGVVDGFKFGCGLLLAGIAFYFALLLIVGAAMLVALILGLPLPFGLGPH